MPATSIESASINQTDLSYQRRLFLGKLIDLTLVTFGIALICTTLARIFFNIYNSPLSTPQIIQGFIGLTLFFIGHFKRSTMYMKAYTIKTNVIAKKLLGIFPFATFLLFIIYRIQLKEIKSYLRLVEEGSLVEWLSFLFLFLSAFIYFIASRKELKKLVGKFTLAISSLTFLLAMEEISWGQMIFNWKSPEFFNQSNAQEETNIHNLIFLHGLPNTFITALFLFSLTLLCLLGWYLRSKRQVQRHTISDFIFPHLHLIGYFSTGAIIYFCLCLELLGIDIPVLISSDQELFECFFALGVLLHSCQIYISWAD